MKGHLKDVCHSKDFISCNKLLRNNDKPVSNFKKHNVEHVAENNNGLSCSNLVINYEDDNILTNVYNIGNNIIIVEPNMYMNLK